VRQAAENPRMARQRLPVQTLFDYLEGGETLEDFLAGFPTVSRELALEAIEEARMLLLRAIDAAPDRRMCRRTPAAIFSGHDCQTVRFAGFGRAPRDFGARKLKRGEIVRIR